MSKYIALQKNNCGEVVAMKKISFILASFMIIAMLSNETACADDTGVKLNGQKFYINFNDCNLLCNSNVYEMNGKEYYPIRDLAEKLGFVIDWDGGSKTILINTETDNIFSYQLSGYIDNLFMILYGCKDIDGNIAVEPEYTYISGESCGLLSVRSGIEDKYKY